MNRLRVLAGWLCVACFMASAGQGKIPARPSSSCIAEDTWHELASAQLSKTREVNAAALSPDGSVLVVAIKDGVLSRIVAYDVATTKMLWDHTLDDAADLLTISGDSSQLAARSGASCKGVGLRHWSLHSGEELPPLAQDGSFRGQVWPSAIAYGGNLIAASVAIGGDLQLWDAKTGETVKSISADFKGLIPHQGLAALVMDRRGTQLAAGGSGVVLRWQLPGATKVKDIGGFGEMPVTCLMMSGDGNQLAAGTHAGIKVFDLQTEQIKQTVDGSWMPVSFLSDGALAVASRTQFGEWRNGKSVGPVQALPAGVRRVFASRNGELMGLDASKPSQVRLIPLKGKEAVREFVLPER